MAQYIKSLGFLEQASAPANPTAGNRKVYIKVDGKMYQKDSSGTETEIGGGGTNGGASRWTLVSSVFTRTSDSTFTMADADATTVVVGLPIRYKDVAGTYNYGIITGKSSSGGITTFTIKGAPMDTSHDAVLEYGFPEMVIQIPFAVNGKFATSSSTTMMATLNKVTLKWLQCKAYMVMFSAKCESDDTGAAQAKVNLYINTAAVLTTNTSAGLEVIDNTWVDSVVDVNTSNYDINYGEPYDLSTDAGGTNKDAYNLSAIAVFVLE